MSDLHCRGCDCEECCPGYPALATRVYVPEDQAPYLPRPIRMATRRCALSRHARYRERKRLRKELAA